MKKGMIWITALIVVIASGCTKDRPVSSEQAIIVEDIVIEEPEDNEETDEAIADSLIAKKFVGTWVEKYPELHDGISDTLVFTEDFKIEKHFAYGGLNYKIDKDTLIITNPENRVFTQIFIFVNDSEIYFSHFIQRIPWTIDFETSFIKVKEEL